MINSFTHKALEKFYETGNPIRLQPAHSRNIRIRLAALDTATGLEDLNLPGFELQPLGDDMKGIWTIDVNKNGRITFRFTDGDSYVVNYEDYNR